MNLLKAEVSDHKFFIRAYNIALLPACSERRALSFIYLFVKFPCIFYSYKIKKYGTDSIKTIDKHGVKL